MSNKANAKAVNKRAAALRKVDETFDKKVEDTKNKFKEKIDSLDKSKDDFDKEKAKLQQKRDDQLNILKGSRKDEIDKINSKGKFDKNKFEEARDEEKKKLAIKKVELEFKQTCSDFKNAEKTDISKIKDNKNIVDDQQKARIDSIVEKYKSKIDLAEIRKEEKLNEIEEKYEDKKFERKDKAKNEDKKENNLWKKSKKFVKSAFESQMVLSDNNVITGECDEYTKGCHKIIHTKDKAFYFQDGTYLPYLSQLMNKLNVRYQYRDQCVGDKEDIFEHILRNVPNTFVNGDCICSLENRNLYRWGFVNGGDFVRNIMSMEELNCSELSNYLPGRVISICFNSGNREFLLECIDSKGFVHPVQIRDGRILKAIVRWGKSYEYNLM